jgi:hypothetical protein
VRQRRLVWVLAALSARVILPRDPGKVRRARGAVHIRLRGALSFLTISLIPMFAVGMLVLGPDRLSLIDHASEGRWVLLIGFCLAVFLVCGTAIERYRQVDR